MSAKATAAAIQAEVRAQETNTQEGALAVWKAGHPDQGLAVRLVAAGLAAGCAHADLVAGDS